MELITIVGARPQFIKAASVSRAISKIGHIKELIVHTGQHFDDSMSAVFFRELEIPAPAVDLGIGGGTHGSMVGRMLIALEAIFLERRPDAILVYGDTNSTLAGALAASKLGIPLVHVEAGLRSYRRSMPEEINRVLTDHMATLLFCPTRNSITNLAQEGISEQCYHVGDVMYDVTLHARQHAEKRPNILDRMSLKAGEYAVATIHRAENTDDRESLKRVFSYLRSAARELQVVLPLHPRTAQAAAEAGVSFEGLSIQLPLGFFDMHRLLMDAALVMTDSGGLQKEAYFHRVPCITMRDETEWLETIDAGWNRLWQGADFKPRTDITDYGTGEAGVLIADKILTAFG